MYYATTQLVSTRMRPEEKNIQTIYDNAKAY